MPLPDLGNLPDNQIVLHFETNNVIEMGQLSTVFSEFARLAYEDPRIGWDSTVVLIRVKSGSPTTAWIEVLNTGGAIAGIGQFGLGVAVLLQENRQRKLCRRIAELMCDNDVTEFSIAVREEGGSANRKITMARSQIPAVAMIEAERNNTQTLPNDRELAGRIVTTHGGRFALFRTTEQDYQISLPVDLLQQVPIGEDLIVDFKKDGDSIEILDWRMASDDHVDWENDQALPGVQVEKLKSLENRAQWPDQINQEGNDVFPLSTSADEERMREVLFAKNDDFVSSDNTATFVGRFEYDGAEQIYRTQSGRTFRIFSPYERKVDQDLVVRAQIVQDDVGERDWLHIMDVFPIDN